MSSQSSVLSTQSSRGFFITGTDTGVGKTLVACALVHAFTQQGRRVAGMKPVAAGAVHTAEGWLNEDVTRLRAAANVSAALTLLNPYCFEPAVAPHIAANEAGVEIDLEVIARAYAQLAAQSDIVIVEGVGGFCVPLNAKQDSADLAVRLALPVLLVVGMRLGCLNHALLTAAAIRARGLALAGWIANRIDPHYERVDANISALVERLGAPLCGDIEYAAAPATERASRELDLAQLP
jgi:dethiobiotin synthetase